jgi:ferritin
LGAAKFFANESSEELEHYAKIAQYFNDRGGVATLPTVNAENDKISDLEAALKTAYETEVELGDNYADWYSDVLSIDPITAQFLLQFIEIQRLSIGEYGDLLTRVQLVGDNKAAVLLIDQEMGG